MLLGDLSNELLSEIMRLSSPGTATKLAETCRPLLVLRDGELPRHAVQIKLFHDQLTKLNVELADLELRLGAFKKGAAISLPTTMKAKSALKTITQAIRASNAESSFKHIKDLCTRDMTGATAIHRQVAALEPLMRYLTKHLYTLEAKTREIGT